MLLFRFITNHPWIFSVFGVMLLALVAYSKFDVERGGNIVPFEQLQVYSGEVVGTKRLGESASIGSDGKRTPIYYEELTVLLADGEKRMCRLLLNEELPVGTRVTVHQDNENKVFHLVADGRLLIDYESLKAYAAKRAQEAHETLTQTRVLVFAGLLVVGGLCAQIRRMHKVARYRQQQQISL